ncbi:bis(5'-nucleosyl)-tetraphosphatase (symmetrical) YqeK, partial [Oceanithermus sp.]
MPSTVSIETLTERVRERVSPERWAHIQRVAELARDVAEAAGADGERAYLAGLLHDVARELSEEELLALCPPQNEVEAAHPRALHGCAGRKIAEALGVTDPEVLEAIEGHVWGVDPDNRVGMAVYVADTSEPGRGVNDDVCGCVLSGEPEGGPVPATQLQVDSPRAPGIP